MTLIHHNTKAPDELVLIEGQIRNTFQGERIMQIIARPQDARQNHRAPAAMWWAIAAAAAMLVIVLSNPIVTDVLLCAGFLVATRLKAVSRRRRRRAAHRAAMWKRMAVLEAVEVANASHRRATVSAA